MSSEDPQLWCTPYLCHPPVVVDGIAHSFSMGHYTSSLDLQVRQKILHWLQSMKACRAIGVPVHSEEGQKLLLVALQHGPRELIV